MSITYDKVVELFEEHTLDIYDRLRLSQVLYSALKKKGLINPAVENELKVAVKTDHEKIDIILQNVQSKGVNAFLDFCLLLTDKRIDHKHIVTDVLGLKLEDIKKQKDGLAVDSASPQVPTPPPSVPGSQAPTGEGNQYIRGGIQDVSVEEALRKLADPSVYPMKSKPRGKAIIINIEKYAIAEKNREGSNTDLVNLTLLLTDLGFKVDPWSNYDSRQIRLSIENERQSPDHAHLDAFVMCVLSHGRKGEMEATDGKYLKIQEDLVNPFNGVNAPGLVNKPKMFFIQACQGAHKTTGVAADGDLEDMMAELSEGRPTDQQPERMSHEMADILVVNSTVEGYSSFRDTMMGSLFMRDLVTVFTEKCRTDHVEDMITEVARKLNDRKIGSGSLKQICNKTSKLTRKVYFLPGYYADS